MSNAGPFIALPPGNYGHDKKRIPKNVLICFCGGLLSNVWSRSDRKNGEFSTVSTCPCGLLQASVHPDTPFEHYAVSRSESADRPSRGGQSGITGLDTSAAFLKADVSPWHFFTNLARCAGGAESLFLDKKCIHTSL
jgi:hypothetical protein